MELKSLILGLVFSLGIFAVKSGAGLSYLVRREAKLTKKTMAILGFIGTYGLIFWLAWLLIRKVNFLEHLDKVMLFFENGMTLHFVLAGLLLVWGIALLKKDSSQSKHTHAWLLLTLPCPVCFSVILFSGSFLVSLSPDIPWLFGGLATGFIVVSLLTSLVIVFASKGNPKQNLGTIMMLVALYFLLSMIVIPQFTDFERIYRLSLGSVTTMQSEKFPLLLTMVSIIFTLSFIKSFWRTRWK
jgi:predicted transporter